MKQPKNEKKWTQQEEDFLRENISKMTISDICTQLGRTENGVNIKLHRMRVDRQKGGIMKERTSRNLVVEMLTQRMGSAESFRYTPGFRERTGILQKRFWQLYRGEKNITEPEYRALSREWKITLEDAFEMGQLKLEF
jgi:hypothetical protein